MGNSIDFRCLENQSQTLNNKIVNLSTYSIRGLRNTMEDTFNNHIFSSEHEFYACGIYDGHAGDEVSLNLKNYMFERLQLNINFLLFIDSECVDIKLLKNAVYETFFEFDKDFCDLDSGSTCIICFVTKYDILCANVGDCRAIIINNIGSFAELSNDHKADYDRHRIISAGGTLDHYSGIWRVNSALAVSRAFGDKSFKIGSTDCRLTHVTVEPEFIDIKRTLELDCLIIASDGIWDVISNKVMQDEYIKYFQLIQQGTYKHYEYVDSTVLEQLKENQTIILSDFVTEETLILCMSKLKEGMNPSSLFTEYICKHAIYLGSSDNCTITIVNV